MGSPGGTRVRNQNASRDAGISRTLPRPNEVLASDYESAGLVKRRGATGTNRDRSARGADNHCFHQVRAVTKSRLSSGRASRFHDRARMGERNAQPHRPKRALQAQFRRPASQLRSLGAKQLPALEVPLEQLDVLATPILADDEVDAIAGEAELHTQVQQARAAGELLALQGELEDVHEELPEVVHGGGVRLEEGSDEVIDVVPGGEAKHLGNDGGDRARRQAVARHRAALAEKEASKYTT